MSELVQVMNSIEVEDGVTIDSDCLGDDERESWRGEVYTTSDDEWWVDLYESYRTDQRTKGVEVQFVRVTVDDHAPREVEGGERLDRPPAGTALGLPLLHAPGWGLPGHHHVEPE